MQIRSTFIVFVLLAISANSYAVPVVFEFGWLGENEYSLTGSFSFDDSLLGTGVITQEELLSFSMAGFVSGALLGTFDDIPEQLFFDTNELLFPVGVNPDDSRNIQSWNASGGLGIGFLSGRFTQSILLDGDFIDDSGFRVPGGLTLTQETSRLTISRVPEPGTLTLLGLGFFGIGLARRRKKV